MHARFSFSVQGLLYSKKYKTAVRTDIKKTGHRGSKGKEYVFIAYSFIKDVHMSLRKAYK